MKLLTDSWKLHVFCEGSLLRVGGHNKHHRGGVLQNFAITANTSVGASVSYSRSHGFDQTEAKVSFNLFF